MKKHELDFQVLREPWNKYHLKDGSYIKSRHVLQKVKKREATEQGEKDTYGFESKDLIVTYNAPENLKGPPSKAPITPTELSKGEEVGFDIISEEWNEYVLEDGTVIRIKNTVVSVRRTDKTDRNGDPIYIVQHSRLLGVKPRKR